MTTTADRARAAAAKAPKMPAAKKTPSKGGDPAAAKIGAAKKKTPAKGKGIDLTVEPGDGDEGTQEEPTVPPTTPKSDPVPPTGADELEARRKAREQAETGEGVTRQTTNGEQLQFTLMIGGALPTSSILKVGGKQITFAEREFAKGDVIPFSGEMRIVEVGARDKKRGTQRFHVAVIDTFELDGEGVGADDE